MGPVSVKIMIDTPRQHVFEILCDLSARPGFMSAFFDRFNLLRENPVGVGAGARFRMLEGGWADTVIVEAASPYKIIEKGRGGYLNRTPNMTEWLLMDMPGNSGCELQATFWTEPEGVIDKLRDSRISVRKVTKGLRRSVAHLRDLAESGEAPERVTIAGGDRI